MAEMIIVPVFILSFGLRASLDKFRNYCFISGIRKYPIAVHNTNKYFFLSLRKKTKLVSKDKIKTNVLNVSVVYYYLPKLYALYASINKTKKNPY